MTVVCSYWLKLWKKHPVDAFTFETVFVFWYTHRICLLVFLEALMLCNFISCVFQFRLG